MKKLSKILGLALGAALMLGAAVGVRPLVRANAVSQITVSYEDSDVLNQGKSGGGGGFSLTRDSIVTVNFSNAYGNSGHIKLYGGCIITVTTSTGYQLDSISMEFTSATYARSFENSSDINSNTWSQTNTTSSQARMTSMSIAYSSVGSTPTPDTFTISYNTNGGIINDAENSYTTNFSEGDSIILPSNVTKSGYVFGGWYDNQNLEGTAVNADSITGSISLYAKWNNIDVNSISNITAENNYYRISGEVVAKNTRNLYIQDSTGAIEYLAATSAELDNVRTGYNVAITAKAVLKNGILKLEKDANTSLEVISNSNRSIEVTPITTLNNETLSNNRNKYVSFTNVKLLDDLSSAYATLAKVGNIEVYLYGVASHMRGDSYTTGFGTVKDYYVNVTGALTEYNSKPEILMETVTEVSSYKATYHLNGGVIESFEGYEIIPQGSTFSRPANNPTKAADSEYNYTFNNWYSDESLETVFDFDAIPSSDVNIYAGYSKTEFDSVTKLTRTETATNLSYDFEKTTTGTGASHSITVNNTANKNDTSATYRDSTINDFEDSTYLLNAAKNLNNIQFKKTDTSGNGTSAFVISKNDNGYIESISITFENDYQLNLFAKNTPYSSVADAFDSSKRGTSLQTLKRNNVTTYTFNTNYKYIALVPSTNAVQVSSIVIKYKNSTSYDFSNIALRFGGLIKKSIWNDVGNISEYGVIVAKSSTLGEDSIQDYFEAADDFSELESIGCIVSSSKVAERGAPATPLASQVLEGVNASEYYIFNAYVSIPKAQIATELAAVAYVKSGDNYYFFKEVRTSVKAMAIKYQGIYGNDAYNGSLAELAK